MLIIRLEGEGALDLHNREFHVVQQHSIWGGPKHAKRQEGKGKGKGYTAISASEGS